MNMMQKYNTIREPGYYFRQKRCPSYFPTPVYVSVIMPPLTWSTCPVTKEESSDAR